MSMRHIALVVFALFVSVPAVAQEPLPIPAPAGAHGSQGIQGQPGSTSGASSDKDKDPTKNVLDLVQALKEMLRELRISDKELFDAKLKGINDLTDLRSRSDRELQRASTERIDSEARLRAEFYAAINATEKDRVNAIRTVDTGAVAIANERATATASALAKTVQDSALVLSAQVTKSADDVRNLVKTTADEQSRNQQQRDAAIQQQFTTFGVRLTSLEQAQSEGKGKAGVSDPAFTALLAEVRALREAGATGAGKSEGISTTLAVMITIGTLLLGVLGIGIPLLLRSRQQTSRRTR